MKNIVLIFLFLVLLAPNIYSQVAIGKETVDGLGILDFASGDRRGLVLPYTNSISNPTNGTLTFDTNSKKIKSFVNNNWVDLSFEGSLPAVVNTNPNLTTDNDVIIGSNTSSAVGVLVLESNNKALILPKVDNVTNIFKPTIGTICYDLSLNALAIYNGVGWSFWK
jgi:hypothetical protein